MTLGKLAEYLSKISILLPVSMSLPINHLPYYGVHQTAIYCDWISRQGFANQNKMLPDARQGEDQMV